MTETSPDDVAEAQRWLGEADDELTVVDVLRADSRIPHRATCVHAHLAAEKALKSVVIFRSIPLPRTHDLVRLLQLCPLEDAKLFEANDLTELNPWTIEGRYPADLEEPSNEQLAVLAASAHRIVASARSILTTGQ
jgi:HEPN domain-containing protein